jgi:hypothetical protein
MRWRIGEFVTSDKIKTEAPLKNKHKHRPRDAYAWSDDPVVEDGDPPVRVPIMVCDNRPGWVRPLTGAQVAERLAVRDAGFTSAGKPDLSLHQPGFRLADQATRDSVSSARNEMIARATSCWQTDNRRRPPDDDPDDPDEDELDRERDRRSADSRSLADIRAGAIRARESYVRRLQDAWRTPKPGPALEPRFSRDAAEPDNGSSAETMRRHLRSEPDDDAQARRDAAWNSYKDNLQRAWMNPGPGPNWKGAGA